MLEKCPEDMREKLWRPLEKFYSTVEGKIGFSVTMSSYLSLRNCLMDFMKKHNEQNKSNRKLTYKYAGSTKQYKIVTGDRKNCL